MQPEQIGLRVEVLPAATGRDFDQRGGGGVERGVLVKGEEVVQVGLGWVGRLLRIASMYLPFCQLWMCGLCVIRGWRVGARFSVNGLITFDRAVMLKWQKDIALHCCRADNCALW